MAESVEVRLPGGIWQEGACVRDAVVRPLGPVEERRFAESAEGALPVELASELLAATVRVEGTADMSALTVGDREALLLHLRRLTVGESLPCVLDCPGEDCGELLELELAVADLLVEPTAEPRPAWHELSLEGRTLRFRLPTGADQERAARAAVAGAADPEGELLAACAPGDAAEWPAELRRLVAERMAELDPQADLSFALTCPACERDCVVPFDPLAYLSEELRGRARALEHEVHLLARAYGWSEEAILALPRARRGRYIRLLEEEGA